MADTHGQIDIRGLDVQKLVTGFAELQTDMVLKKFMRQATTEATEMRWFQKTAGFLDSHDTTGITASRIEGVSRGAKPVVVPQSWTRNTSYALKFFVESGIITEEDIKEADVDVLATMIEDLTLSILRREEIGIMNVLTENQSAVNILTTASTAAWNAGSGQDPIKDLLVARRKIRQQYYSTAGAAVLLSATDLESLITWLISTKGASIPAFASQRVEDGVVTEILGLKVIESEVMAADSAVVFIPQKSVCVKTFMPLSSFVIRDEGIGRNVRILLESKAILEHPKSVHLITNTQS